jgi:hypothetical protein
MHAVHFSKNGWGLPSFCLAWHKNCFGPKHWESQKVKSKTSVLEMGRGKALSLSMLPKVDNQHVTSKRDKAKKNSSHKSLALPHLHNLRKINVAQEQSFDILKAC